MADPKVMCSNFKCRKEKPQSEMLHLAGGYYCDEKCRIQQLMTAVRERERPFKFIYEKGKPYRV